MLEEENYRNNENKNIFLEDEYNNEFQQLLRNNEELDIKDYLLFQKVDWLIFFHSQDSPLNKICSTSITGVGNIRYININIKEKFQF